MARQRAREAAEHQARFAARAGDEYEELLAEAAWYASKGDWRKAARACRQAIALRPDKPMAYLNLGVMLTNSGHGVEAAQRYLEAKERLPVGSKKWAEATAEAFEMLRSKACDEVAKPEWWNDEGLKALSARVVRAAPNHETAHGMRAEVLSGRMAPTEALTAEALMAAAPADLKEAAGCYDRAAALCITPAKSASYASSAVLFRDLAEVMNSCMHFG